MLTYVDVCETPSDGSVDSEESAALKRVRHWWGGRSSRDKRERCLREVQQLQQLCNRALLDTKESDAFVGSEVRCWR
jgi:hypothetical protein